MNKVLRIMMAVVLLAGLSVNNKVKACTSVLVSGKVSKDGRPFIC